jgi:hypothetical protein
MAKLGSGRGSDSVVTDLHAGLVNRSPKAPDGKLTRGDSVDDDATRSATAKTPPSLGPRTA